MDSGHLEADTLPSIVLLVDRDQTMVASYSTRFETEGLWVSTCTNPLEVIDAVRELRPDLVVTDTFDDVDFDLVGTLKSDPEMRKLPVILLADPDHQSVGSANLAEICLSKPVSSERLLQSSRSLIARSHELRKRSDQTRSRAHNLVMKSGDMVRRSPLDSILAWPGCGHSLEWIERGRLLGVEYDYYRWCVNGCGLYCYERRAESWIKLV